MTTHDLANWRERSSTVREYLKDIESALYQADDEKFRTTQRRKPPAGRLACYRA